MFPCSNAWARIFLQQKGWGGWLLQRIQVNDTLGYVETLSREVCFPSFSVDLQNVVYHFQGNYGRCSGVKFMEINSNRCFPGRTIIKGIFSSPISQWSIIWDKNTLFQDASDHTGLLHVFLCRESRPKAFSRSTKIWAKLLCNDTESARSITCEMWWV